MIKDKVRASLRAEENRRLADTYRKAIKKLAFPSRIFEYGKPKLERNVLSTGYSVSGTMSGMCVAISGFSPNGIRMMKSWSLNRSRKKPQYHKARNFFAKPLAKYCRKQELNSMMKAYTTRVMFLELLAILADEDKIFDLAVSHPFDNPFFR